MSIEAMKLALEALETAESFDIDADDGYYLKAITALQQSIEQAQKQEPRNIRERWNIERDGDDLLVCFNDHEKSEGCRYERYVLADTSPPQHQPLTPESVFQIADQHPVEGFDPDIMAFARAIEAAHGIKGEA